MVETRIHSILSVVVPLRTAQNGKAHPPTPLEGGGFAKRPIPMWMMDVSAFTTSIETHLVQNVQDHVGVAEHHQANVVVIINKMKQA